MFNKPMTDELLADRQGFCANFLVLHGALSVGLASFFASVVVAHEAGKSVDGFVS